ncbi:hypothetical protein ACTU6U_07940 [Microbacterium sp. A196]|uniref:hypothetical protein n=1 Tax=Microbacterium sp. A196 TaxID=3457320 RepID=UPI003FCF036F
MSRCWSEGAYVNWPSTPGGNEIEQASMSPGEVVSTAGAMITIASRMKSAATTLQELANSDDGQQGKAVEKLRDSVGETWQILGDAGALYYDTADAIRTYGWAIGDVGGIAEALATAYSDADEKWSTYAGTDGDLYGDVAAEDGDDDPNAEADAADNKAKYDAFQAWMNAADHWDQQYDDWETAWNQAVSAIENAHEHGPKDGWSEWFGDFLEIAYNILAVVAIIVAVVFIVCTFVITGPIAAAIAGIAATVGAIIGIATAVISIVRFARGETNLLTLAIDLVCAVPGLGPLANAVSDMGPLVTKLGVGASGLADFLPSTVRIAADGGLDISRVFADSVSDLIVHGSVGAGMLFDIPNVLRVTDFIADTGIDTVISQYSPLSSVNTVVSWIKGDG